MSPFWKCVIKQKQQRVGRTEIVRRKINSSEDKLKSDLLLPSFFLFLTHFWSSSPPHTFYCICFAVSGNEDCLWYVDKNGTWHNGFDCPLITFCCGNCHRRYCCLDAFKMITEREQKRCMLFQFRWGRQQQGFNLMTYLLIYLTPRVSVCVHNSRLSLLDRIPFISVRQTDTLTSC